MLDRQEKVKIVAKWYKGHSMIRRKAIDEIDYCRKRLKEIESGNSEFESSIEFFKAELAELGRYGDSWKKSDFNTELRKSESRKENERYKYVKLSSLTVDEMIKKYNWNRVTHG